MGDTAENDARRPLPCWGEEDQDGVWHCAVCGRRGDEDCDPGPHWGSVPQQTGAVSDE